MSIVLLRVDERLIHGQVVIGWGHELRPDRYVVVDDTLAESEWEQGLYRLGAGGTDVVFLTASEAAAALAEYGDDASRTVILTRDVATMRRLAEGAALKGRTVNVGGLHHGPGRKKVLTYIHLTPSEAEDVRRLVDEGVRVQARDLPDAPKVDLAAELGFK
ncbi:MAG: PTS sugar transporter subunit IIB [Gemmatimonadota bacterium]|nr:PTS sugar transporter subunit IIB [Gemmatimonadota bacterium]